MRLRDKVADMSPLSRGIIISLFSVIIIALAAWGTVCAMSKQVSIVDDKGEEISFITYASKTEKVLAEQGVTLGEWDRVSIPLDQNVRDGDKIYVFRDGTFVAAEK